MDMDIEEILCSVCYNTFRRPSTLPCGHTFCFSCLQSATKQHHNCPICRHHLTSTTSKIGTDQVLTSFIQSVHHVYKKETQKQKIQNTQIQCKQQNILLVDITTDDLLLPYNKISVTFELQSNMLIDRLQRFVARQQLPFNKYGVISRLVHIQQLRRNLYKAVIQGTNFCKIQSQTIQRQISQQLDQDEYFYRCCNTKEITQYSNININQYNFFFQYFNRIQNGDIKHHIYQQIDHHVFMRRSDAIAVFYSILGIIDMKNEEKYRIAVEFDQEKRVKTIKEYVERKKKKLERNPSALLKGQKSFGSDKWPWLCMIFLLAIYMMFKGQFNSQL